MLLQLLWLMSHRKLSLDISKLSHNSTILEDFLVKSCVENLEVIVLSLTKLLCDSVFCLFLDKLQNNPHIITQPYGWNRTRPVSYDRFLCQNITTTTTRLGALVVEWQSVPIQQSCNLGIHILDMFYCHVLFEVFGF